MVLVSPSLPGSTKRRVEYGATVSPSLPGSTKRNAEVFSPDSVLINQSMSDFEITSSESYALTTLRRKVFKYTITKQVLAIENKKLSLTFNQLMCTTSPWCMVEEKSNIVYLDILN